MDLPRQHDVILVAATAGKQSDILEPTHRLADSELHRPCIFNIHCRNLPPRQPSTAVKSACTSARLSAGSVKVCRAGRDSGSGNILTHSVFSAARCDTGS